MKLKFNRFFVPVFLFVIFYSCKKEVKDVEAPTIVLESPNENQLIQLGDTLRVKGKVVDNVNIDFVFFHLTDANGTIVQGSSNFTEYEKGKSFDFDFEYIVNDESLESGNYYFKISAGDSYQISTKSILLQLNSPLKKLGYCITLKKNNYQFESYYADTNFQLNAFNGSIYNQEPTAYFISDKYKIFGLCGRFNEPLKQFSMINYQTINTETSLGGTMPYFTCANSDNSFFYIGYYNDSIGRKNPGANGNLAYSSSNPIYYPFQISLLQNNLCAQFYSKNASGNKFIVFDKNTGQELSSFQNSHVKIFAFDAGNNQCYLIEENSAGSNQISLLNFFTGIKSNLISLPAGKINDACAINLNQILIAHSNGNLYQFNYNPLNLVSIHNSNTFKNIFYSETENYLYGSSGKSLLIYDKLAYAINLRNSQVFSDTICNFKINFSR